MKSFKCIEAIVHGFFKKQFIEASKKKKGKRYESLHQNFDMYLLLVFRAFNCIKME